MDKNILTIGICIFIFYIVYLKINQNNKKDYHKEENKEDKVEELKLEEYKNISKPLFDPYTYYKSSDKYMIDTTITKDNYDFDYETDFKYKNLDIIDNNSCRNIEHFSYNNQSLDPQGIPLKLSDENIYLERLSTDMLNKGLVLNEFEPNFVYSMPFPENTSVELATFTAENVTNLYNSNNMEDLYNNINADPYKGYKTLNYML
jgi:hypothetical protein